MIIEKYLKETYGFISEISKSEIYEVQVGKTKSHSFNNRNLTLEKNEDEFCFSLSTLIKKGIDRNEELKINKETTVKLTNNKRSIYIKGKYVLVRHISYPDLDTNILEKTIKGQINSLSTENFNFYKKQRCYRIIIPIEDLRVRLTGDFTGWGFKVDSKFTSETLVKLVINKKEYHFFTNSINKKYFIVIDSMEDQSLEDFQKYANSILLAFAFLKGNYHGKEAFIFSYKSNDFKEPKSMMSTILGGGIYNGFSVHSSSPHSLMLSKKETKYKKDKEGNIIGFDDRNLRKFMVEFPAESFAKLCELICNKGGF
ncbi:MAG: hypothetical protein M0D53_00660 [Flavobacterium sp. JAD_PAG50586_2]|nr:MAG: hypothetical protein M0D53_00660 [Flavobacterium sp. JAD_PAG50586_2]